MNDTKYHLQFKQNKIRTYQVIETETGKLLCEAHSHRHYIAMIVYVSPMDGKTNVAYRFGREELIGKGGSANAFKSPSGNFYLARLKQPEDDSTRS